MGFTGYRVFNTLNFNGEILLASLNPRPHYYKFFGPVSTGAIPGYRNHAGFYTFKTYKHLYNAFAGRLYLLSASPCSIGIVAPWAEVEVYGTVIEHEIGYRSSKLLIKSLTVMDNTFKDEQIRLMERRYCCEVTVTKLPTPKQMHDDYWKGVI